MTEFHFGKLLGQGMERACYLNEEHPDRCFKVSKKEHSKQTLREAAYFKFLQKKNIVPSFMPKFFGLHETADSYILEQEYIPSTPQTPAMTLHDFVLQASNEEMRDLDNLLDKLLDEMLRLNIIVSDMRTTNLLVLTHERKPVKIIIFDGYGAPEFIPLPNWFRCLGAQKIHRQWNKFQRYYDTDKKLRAETRPNN